MAVCQNLVPLVNIKIAGKWMFIPLKMVLIGKDPYPYDSSSKDISVYLDMSLKLQRSKRSCPGRDSWSLVGFRVNLELVKHSGGYETDTSVQATDTFNGLVLLGKS